MKKALTIYIPDDAEFAGTVGDLYLKREGEESFLHYRIGGDVLAKDQEFYAPFEGAMKVVHGGNHENGDRRRTKKSTSNV